MPPMNTGFQQLTPARESLEYIRGIPFGVRIGVRPTFSAGFHFEPFFASSSQFSANRIGKNFPLTIRLKSVYIQTHQFEEREVTRMKLADQIKPISYLKAHAAEIVRNLREKQNPLIITQNGEARVVVQDIESYEQTQETMALLKILALGNRQIEDGKVEPASDVIHRLRQKRRNR
jgi:prevent-host-death family protein